MNFIGNSDYYRQSIFDVELTQEEIMGYLNALEDDDNFSTPTHEGAAHTLFQISEEQLVKNPLKEGIVEEDGKSSEEFLCSNSSKNDVQTKTLKVNWSEKEDKCLLDVLSRAQGKWKWTFISYQLKLIHGYSRSAKQVRERYAEHLAVGIIHSISSKDEDILEQLFPLYLKEKRRCHFSALVKDIRNIRGIYYSNLALRNLAYRIHGKIYSAPIPKKDGIIDAQSRKIHLINALDFGLPNIRISL